MSNMSPIAVLLEWLDSYLNFEKLPQKNIFWLDTMEFLCRRFNHPESCAPAFHVAGSKGKGSISTMIASILEEAGYKTGLYTSPHIINFEERIGSAHGTFTEDIYEKAARTLMNNVDSIIPEDLPEERPITWFELVTMYAFLCFKEAQVEQAVYEVGLGGRLDATNVITPKVCCIGPIELEHTEFLGDTVEKIAAEKGGIIKQRVPVIIARQKKSVREVFSKIASDRNAPAVFIEDVLKDVKTSYCDAGMKIKISFADSAHFVRPIKTTLNLLGNFQAYNAAIACLAVKTVHPEIKEEVIERGLSKAKLPGRFEICKNVNGYEKIPALILDGAHTVNSVRNTMNTMQSIFADYKGKADLLFACAADKDAEDIAPLFKNEFSKITLTRPGEVKQSNMEKLVKAFTDAGFAFKKDENYKNAIEGALEQANDAKTPLLITGSFYLVSEVKKILAEKL